MPSTWIVFALILSFAGCASGGRPTPDAVFRHPVTGDVQWCDKGPVAAAALGGVLVAASQAGDYAGCKSGWEDKGYLRLGAGEKLSEGDQRRYEEERERLNKALADSIRKN